MTTFLKIQKSKIQNSILVFNYNIFKRIVIIIERDVLIIEDLRARPRHRP